MITLEKIQAMKRIKAEFEELNKNPNPNLGLIVTLIERDN